MSITLEEAFAALHNHDVREPLRKYHPQYALVAVDETDAIVKFEKFKHVPEGVEMHRFSADCKGTAMFVARAESYPTLEQFRQRVVTCGNAYRKQLRGIKDDPDTYYGGTSSH